jgi:predicted DNA-binding ribbon-helix-helix protein
MTDTRTAQKSRAAALFRELVARDHRDALAEDKTRVDQEREKMVRLKAQRLAAGGQEEAVRRRARDASLVKKRTVTIGHRHTSMAIEDAFWSALKEIAASEKIPLNQLAAQIDAGRQYANFSSAARLFVLNYDVKLAEEHAGRKRRKHR